MRIWVDLANSPQVLFFRPILAELKRRGHEVVITTRDYAQTRTLADEYGIEHTVIGQHGGKYWRGILQRNLGRVYELNKWVHTQSKFDLAVSHNSYTQALSATWLRIPFVTLMDYEHQPLNHICFRLAKRVIVPEPFPDRMLAKFGALAKAKKYPGLKEEIYLLDFHSDPAFLKKHGFDQGKVVIVLRPPAPWTAYHRFENTLFDDVVKYLSKFENATIIFLPRIDSQGEWASQLGLQNLVIPVKTLNGPNLIFFADLVISGGGTMNREAAVLGTPTYTVFKGKMGAVDKYLIDCNRMTQILGIPDIEKIKVEKKISQGRFMLSPGLVEQVTNLIVRDD